MDLYHLKDSKDIQHDFKASWHIVQHFEIEVFALPIFLLQVLYCEFTRCLFKIYSCVFDNFVS
jgi:hypothetical protein